MIVSFRVSLDTNVHGSARGIHAGVNEALEGRQRVAQEKPRQRRTPGKDAEETAQAQGGRQNVPRLPIFDGVQGQSFFSFGVVNEQSAFHKGSKTGVQRRGHAVAFHCAFTRR